MQQRSCTDVLPADYAAFLLDAFGAASYEVDLATGMLGPSPRLNVLYGYPPDHPLTLADCEARYHPDDRAAIGRILPQILAGGEPRFQHEFRIRLSDGGLRWARSYGEVIFGAAGRPTHVRGAAIDITERKRLEEHRAFLDSIMADFAPLKAADDIMRIASAKTAAYFGLSRCVFVEINEAADEARVIYDYCKSNLPSLVGTYRLVDFHTDEERQALGAGRPIVVHNVADETRTPEAAERFTQLQIGALVNASYVSNGRWQFVLSAMQAEPRAWHADEVELLRELSARIWPRIARARAEEALRLSEERYRTLIDSIDQAFCLIEMLYDPEGRPVDYRFLKVNKTFERHTGLHDVVGKTVHELVPNLEPQWVEMNAQVAETGEPLRFELAASSLGRWFEVEAVRVGAAESRQIGLLFTDVTARRQAEADARFLSEVSEQIRVQEDADRLLDAVTRLLGRHLGAERCFLAEVDGGGAQWRVRHEHRTPAAPAPLAAEYQLSAIPPPLQEALRAGHMVCGYDAALDKRTAPFYEATYRPLGVRAFAVTPLRHSGRWVAALNLSDSAPRLWTAHELSLLETVAERAWNAVERLWLAADQRAYAARLQRLNAASLLINAASTREEVLHLTAEQARLLTDARRSATRAAADTPAGRNPAPDPCTSGAEARPRAQICLSAPLVGRDERALGLIELSDKAEGEFSADDEALLVQLAQVAAIALENRELYAQEQAARAQAEQASRLKDEFLATVSHELRTPLTAFLGYAQLLRQRKRDEAYTARAVEMMIQSAKAQAVLIEDLLDVSRIVSGKLRIRPEPIALSAVIQAALDTVRPTVEAKGLHLDVELPAAGGVVLGDANRLQQVVWNLLANATKFTPSGGQIVVRLTEVAGNVELSVSDSGQGISREFLPYVFERFRQADSSSQRSHGGLGLGLAIVRHLVELHGGAVEAASAGVGEGAVFTVRLPMIEISAEPPGAPAAARPDEGPRPLSGLRVLVVDDQPAVLALLSEILSASGATVQSCATAPEALALARAWRPDVLVADIAMPDADGYWLIRELRRLPADEGGATPALALTAYVRIEDRLRVLDAGFQQYLPKPVEAAELRDVILRLAALRPERRGIIGAGPASTSRKSPPC